MIQKHRISTNIGKDQLVTVELKQDYDFLEILSLKFTQQDVYTSICADYGVVCGRITANNGLGIPNARVSIFIPLSNTDAEDPVISKLYPYTSVDIRDDNNYRYNLLPARKQHGGHEPTGTFPDQRDVLTREEILEVYEKYYKYTVRTNDAGDFMIWGVPVGEQNIHVDVDLSDISCFSFRPDDFIRKGAGVDDFKSSYEFKSSSDIDDLPQIVSFDRSFTVYPFWGNQDLCELGISRVDFDLSSRGIKIEPTAYFIGSVYTDSGDVAVGKGCGPSNRMGEKCSLVTGGATIEAIRFKNAMDTLNRPILEEFNLKEDVDEDGSFVMNLPMNMEYLYTNEFGENEITNDPKKGVPTSACYRFRITMKNTQSNGSHSMASYLVPNIREYSNEDQDLSYNFSLNWEDYPTGATTSDVIFYNQQGSFYPKDYFFRLNYNKVYTLSSFMGSYFSSNGLGTHTYLGIKEIAPKKEDDCESSIVTPPANWGMMNINFSILLAITINIFERIIYQVFVAAIQVLIVPFQFMVDKVKLDIDWLNIHFHPFDVFDDLIIEPLQRFGTVRLGITPYPDCVQCNNINGEDVVIPSSGGVSDPTQIYTIVKKGLLYPDTAYEGMGSNNIDNSDPTIKKLYITVPNSTYPKPSNTPGEPTWGQIILNPSKYNIRIGGIGFGNPLYVYSYSHTANDPYDNDLYYYIANTTYDNTTPTNNNQGVTYELFDTTQVPLNSPFASSSNVTSESLPVGCAQYMTTYDEFYSKETYCVSGYNSKYEDLKNVKRTLGFSCSGGKNPAGQVIYKSLGNACKTCETWSGYSEFRNGLYRIIPAADTKNWEANISAIDEYCRRKLVGKLFCEGLVNYSFLDNWLSGSLYFFPFKSRVVWDDEETLDLSVYSTSYCQDLVYFKAGTIENPDKRFYYRSSWYNPNTGKFNSARGTLAHPTTIVDLGPRDEFIKEICIDPNLDPNCSVVRNIGPTSYKDFKGMLGLYINYKLDVASPSVTGDIYAFFRNSGFNSRLPVKMYGQVLNGDILQLMSMNSEVGIDGFDLLSRKYEMYNPVLLDPDVYTNFFKDNDGGANGPLPIQLKLDEIDGYRVRACLNEPGRLTESSQVVPFYLWNKNGEGFGKGVNQAWYYPTPGNENTIEAQPLQGMTYNYNYNADSTHKYLLLPMTKNYNGDVIQLDAIVNPLTASSFNVEYFNYDEYGNFDSTTFNKHTNYDNQEEGFTFLYITNGDGTLSGTSEGRLYTRVGDVGGWNNITWSNTIDYILSPTTNNYSTSKQILSTPYLYYFGLKPGKTAVDKFIKRFGPLGAFKSAE
jgi:hypothetical protein